jgi:hypothetical protein
MILSLARWIHLHRQTDNLFKTFTFEMSSFADQLTDSREPFKVSLLRRHQRIRLEVWQHFGYQFADVPYFEFESLIRSVRSDRSASPLLLNRVQELSSICVLADREARSNLPTKAVSLAWLKRDAETTFSIYETGDVRIQIHRQGSGPACYGIFRFHPGISTPESLRGSSCDDLTLGITRGRLCVPVGLHRFEPVEWNGITSAPGNSITRQGISLP